MLRLQRSPADQGNARVKKAPRSKRQTNSAYLKAHSSKTPGSETEILLIGGTGPVDFRLRVAQSHARDDLMPSAWSHAAVLAPPAKNSQRRKLWEIPLSGRAASAYPPATNGVVESELEQYDDPVVYPNIAVLRVPVSTEVVEEVVERFRRQRTVLDSLELMLAWWAFGWGVGRAGNPLLEEIGIPSAAFVEYTFSAAGYDLVPGFPSRSSCPEAIWQSARWWHDHPRMVPPELSSQSRELPPISGAYDAEHYLVPAPKS
jgi:hypothetical protein